MKAVTALRRSFGHARRRIDQHRYITVPRQHAARELADYSTSVTAEHPGAIEARGKIAAFVHWNVGKDIDPSTARMIEALRDGGYAVLLVSNSPLSDTQKSWLAPRCWRLLERDNVGFDFGAWKDALHYLYKHDVALDRLILVNDSVFFSDRGLDALVEDLDGTADVISAFENWGEGYHMQSFALSFSGHVAKSQPFRDFWASYLPVSNRIHAIESGEKLLSRVALKAAESSEVIYSNARLYHALLTRNDPQDSLINLPMHWRDYFRSATHKREDDSEWVANKIIDVMNATSPIHAGAYYFPKYLNCPLYKNDLVYRGRFQFWEIEAWLPEVMSDEIGRSYLTRLRAKGDPSALSPLDRRLYNIGVK